MFGIPVEAAQRSHDDLPLVVRDTIRSVLVTKGARHAYYTRTPPLIWPGYLEEGIFRVSGSHSDMQALKQQYNSGRRVDWSTYKDPHLPAGANKFYQSEICLIE